MAVVRVFGKPDLFVTMTCNPKWDDITRELSDFQTANDRPELVARVFRMKVKAAKKDIINRKLFGSVDAFICVIEFQKRGLPHMHMLIILSKDDKIRRIEDFDNIISAELPDPIEEPEAFKTISKCMMHGPCGPDYPNAPCMVDGACSKIFLSLTHQKRILISSEMLYIGVEIKLKGKMNGFQFDNRYVVAHSKYFATK